MDFLHKVYHSLLVLRNARQYCAQGPFYTVKSPTKSTKMQKNMALNKITKGHWFMVQELKQEGRAPPYLTSAGNVCMRRHRLSLPCSGPCMAMKVLWVWMWGLHLHFSESVNLQIMELRGWGSPIHSWCHFHYFLLLSCPVIPLTFSKSLLPLPRGIFVDLQSASDHSSVFNSQLKIPLTQLSPSVPDPTSSHQVF